jgi:hypothetical protein
MTQGNKVDDTLGWQFTSYFHASALKVFFFHNRRMPLSRSTFMELALPTISGTCKDKILLTPLK